MKPAVRVHFFSTTWQQLRRLRRHDSGSAAVEFGLIALVSLELITETLQAGMYFYTSAALERTTWRASRQILTGGVAGQGLSAAQFRTTYVCPSITSTHLSCNNIITNVQNIPEGISPAGFYSLVNSNQTALIQPPLSNSQTSYCIGSSGSYIFVQILYAMPVFSPIWRTVATSFNGIPSYIIQATAAFRNEPFQTASGTC